MPKTSPKSILGATKKAEREKARQIIAALSGKSIFTLNPSQKDDLLIALCILAGIVNKDGII